MSDSWGMKEMRYLIIRNSLRTPARTVGLSMLTMAVTLSGAICSPSQDIYVLHVSEVVDVVLNLLRVETNILLCGTQ
jgi:hypothetical protein